MLSLVTCALAWSPLLGRSASGPTLAAVAIAPTPAMFSVCPARSAFPARRGSVVVASESVVVGEDYKLALSLIALGALILFVPALPGGFLALLGAFLIAQTLRIRFVFDDEALEVKTKEFDELFSGDASLVKTGDNFAVGGDNRWKYDAFVNWEFFPSEALPILVYFKETQTPAEKWDVGPGKWANSDDALARGAAKGQVHFFPCIASAATLKEQFVSRGCAKL